METHTNVYKMSRLEVCEEIDENTPIVVLREISEAHSIPLLINTILGSKYVVDEFSAKIRPFYFHRPLKDEEISDALRFVNPHISWTREQLQTILDHVEKFIMNPFQPTGTFKYGNPTPSSMFSYNACMLYRILRLHHVQIYKFATIDQLANAVTIITRKEEYSRSIVYNLLTQMNTSQLLKYYLDGICILGADDPQQQRIVIREENSDSGEDSKEEDNFIWITLPEITEISYSSIELSMKMIDNKEQLLKRIVPRTDAEAIGLAARNFQIDLSFCSNATLEYARLSASPLAYIPADKKMLALTRINPLILRLDVFFNPFLPSEVYHETVLQNLALAEGYDRQMFDEIAPYSLLQEAYYSDTFHHGKYPGIKSEMTVIDYEEIINIHENVIICFGQRHSSLDVFRYKELASYFRASRCFRNPMISNELFKSIHIRKLKNLCEMSYVDDQKEHIAERHLLRDAIIFVELLTTQNSSKLRALYDIYNTADEHKSKLMIIEDRPGLRSPTPYPIRNTRSVIRNAITKLFLLGMFMRGWTGLGAYPIEDTRVDPEKYGDVYIRVTASIMDLEVSIKELGDLGIIIKDLPLVRYLDGEYIPSDSPQEGLTVGERLEIVKNGDDHSDTNSCIRLSSNWIATTAHRVMQILGMPLPFEIERLRDIS